MDKPIASLTTMLLLLTSGMAAAQQSIEPPPFNENFLNPDVFRAIDVDRNGSISAQELHRQAIIVTTLSEHFAQADQNADGAIDESEFAAIEIVPEPAEEAPELPPESVPETGDSPPPGNGST